MKHSCKCTNVRFSFIRALRVVVASLVVRMRLHKVAIDMDIPRLRNDYSLFRHSDPITQGLKKILWVLRDDQYLEDGGFSRGDIAVSQALNQSENSLLNGEGKESTNSNAEVSSVSSSSRKTFDGRTHIYLDQELKMWELEELTNFEYVLDKARDAYYEIETKPMTASNSTGCAWKPSAKNGDFDPWNKEFMRGETDREEAKMSFVVIGNANLNC